MKLFACLHFWWLRLPIVSELSRGRYNSGGRVVCFLLINLFSQFYKQGAVSMLETSCMKGTSVRITKQLSVIIRLKA